MKNLYDNYDQKFYDDLNKAIVHHRENCFSFDKYLNSKKFVSVIDKNNINTLPYIHVSIFKRYSENLISVNKKDILKKLSSSATSGLPSTIYLDKDALSQQSKMMGDIMKDYLGNERRPMVIYDLEPKKDSINDIGARYAAIAGYLRFSKGTFFALKKNEGKIYLDIEGLKKFILNNDNIIHFGFTYIIFQYLLNTDFQVDLQKNNKSSSSLIHIGGWKKLEANKVSKKIFDKLCKEKLQINKVIDIYGFTELMGINFPDCEYGWKHLPNNVKLVVRDEKTRLPVKNENKGLLHFISPFTKSYAGVSILTDDVGIMSSEKCKCGRNTNKFKIIGRKKKSENRGCGDILSEKFQKSEIEKPVIYNFFNEDELDLKKSIDQLISLKNIPTIVLVKMISEISKKWLTDKRLIDYRQQGLSFLIRWCSESNLLKLLNESLQGNYQYLDGFQHSNINEATQLKCSPKGLVSHWVAGNVPLLSMLILVQSIITKNNNIVKLSSSAQNTLIFLLDHLKNVKISYLGKKYLGKAILKSLLICKFSRENLKENIIISKVADVKISWGGGDSMVSIKNLPSKTNCHNMLFGPKTSFSLVSQDYLDYNNNFRRYFLKMARDISSFEQKACSSPHTIFYKGDNIDKFCSNLSSALDQTLKIIPKNIDDNDFQNITEAIELGDFIGDVYKNKDHKWVIIKNDNFILEKPVFSRVIFVKSIKDFDSINKLIYDEVQTVSLGLLGKEKLKVANALSDLGVIRFPDPGLMTNFDNPWDGKIVVNELVKFSVLGGPFLK